MGCGNVPFMIMMQNSKFLPFAKRLENVSIMQVMYIHASHVFRAKNDISRHITHLVQRGAFDRALYDLALVKIEMGGGNHISNTCNIVKVL
jgi:hypothetical protein